MISRYRDKAGIGSLIGIPASVLVSLWTGPEVIPALAHTYHNLRSELSERIGEISATPMMNPTLLRHVRGSDYCKRM